MIRQQYEARQAELSEMMREKQRSEVLVQIRRLEASLAESETQVKQLQQIVNAQQKEAERFGKSNVDIEMLRADIKNLDLLLAEMVKERSKLNVEVRAPGRVTLIQRAEAPVTTN